MIRDTLANKYAIYVLKRMNLSTSAKQASVHDGSFIWTTSDLHIFYTLYESVAQENDHLILDSIGRGDLNRIASSLPSIYYKAVFTRLIHSQALTTPSLLKIALYYMHLEPESKEAELFKKSSVDYFVPLSTFLLSRQPLYTSTVAKGSFDSR